MGGGSDEDTVRFLPVEIVTPARREAKRRSANGGLLERIALNRFHILQL